MAAPVICEQCQAGNHAGCLEGWSPPSPPGELPPAGGWVCICRHDLADEKWHELLVEARRGNG